MKNTKHRTRLLLVSAGAVAAVCAAVLVFVMASTARQDQTAPGINPAAFTLPPTVPALAAADSDTVVLAPYSSTWWKKIASMAPFQSGLLTIDPAKAGAPILRLGYSRGPDHIKHDIPNTGPERLIYLEAASSDDANKIAAWLQRAPGFDSRRVHVQDRTVVVGQSWDADYTVPEKSMATISAYIPGDGTKQASMWMNLDQENVSLTGGADTKNGALYATIMSKGAGFKPGTTWTGLSNNGDSWTGDFRSGGVSKELISTSDAQEAVTSTEKVLFESTSGNATTKIIDPGAGNLMTSTSIIAVGNRFGGGTVSADFPKVDNQIVSMVSDVTKWNAAASGNYSGEEAVNLRAISANATSMIVSYTYQDPTVQNVGTNSGLLKK
jgi:hypothetical protein